MKSKLIFVLLCLVLLCLSISNSFGSKSELQSAILANPCAGCHGTDGESPGSIPKLNNLSANYIKLNMLAYKSGKRKGSVMNRIARGYTTAEIDLLAKYFSK